METKNGLLSVGAIAARDYRKAEIFQKYGIDYCCGGGITLEEAAKNAGVALGELVSALDAVEFAGQQAEIDYMRWSPVKLADYIEKKHHRYVRESLQVLMEYGRKVAGHHGEKHPELIELDLAIRAEAHDLLTHIEREELVLFPAIRRLVAISSGAAGGAAVHIGQLKFVKQAIAKMQAEHTSSGDSFEKIRQLTNHYQAPEEACNSYRYLYEKLKEFDEDLRMHIHLENNILFPAALSMVEAGTAR